MKKSSHTIRWINRTAVILLVAPIAYFGFFASFPLSRLNYRFDQVDINSGQIRHVSYFLYRRSESVEQTGMSRVLAMASNSSPPPDWRFVVGRSPVAIEDGMYYAIGDIRNLELVWQHGAFSNAAKLASARQLIAIWQTGKNGFTYIEKLARVGGTKKRNGETAEVGDLP